MDDVMRVVDDVLQLIVHLGEMLLGSMETIGQVLRDQMTNLGVPIQAQSIVLVLLAIAAVLLAVRVLGGLLRFAVIVVLIILAIRLALPNIMNSPH